MTTVAERLTADDYLAREDPRRTELIDGTVVVNEPSVLHQRVVRARSTRRSLAWTRTRRRPGQRRACRSTCALDDATVLAPDVLWFAERARPRRRHAPRACPTSPSRCARPATWVYDVGRKRDLYERHGAARAVAGRHRQPHAARLPPRPAERGGFDVAARARPPSESLRSPLLPGFAATVGELMPAGG